MFGLFVDFDCDLRNVCGLGKLLNFLRAAGRTKKGISLRRASASGVHSMRSLMGYNPITVMVRFTKAKNRWANLMAKLNFKEQRCSFSNRSAIQPFLLHGRSISQR
jgi:hypothetical protein